MDGILTFIFMMITIVSIPTSLMILRCSWNCARYLSSVELMTYSLFVESWLNHCILEFLGLFPKINKPVTKVKIKCNSSNISGGAERRPCHVHEASPRTSRSAGRLPAVLVAAETR